MAPGSPGRGSGALPFSLTADVAEGVEAGNQLEGGPMTAPCWPGAADEGAGGRALEARAGCGEPTLFQPGTWLGDVTPPKTGKQGGRPGHRAGGAEGHSRAGNQEAEAGAMERRPEPVPLLLLKEPWHLGTHW